MGLTGSQFLEGVTLLREGGGVSKLKSEIFNDKKSLQTTFFSVTTKNLNWEVLHKNLVTF